MKKNKRAAIVWCLVFMTSCAINILGARYYRLLENERRLFLGLRAIDSTVAMEYLNLANAGERRTLYENFWAGREDERREFEARTEYAIRTYGVNAPLSDDRILVYVKHGPPSRRQEIIPQKLIAITAQEVVRPAEIWTYKKEGVEFDFIRIARAYKVITKTEFGDNVQIPYFREDTLTAPPEFDSVGDLRFSLSFGRFRQKKNLTRLEIYLNVTFGHAVTENRFARNIVIRDGRDSVVVEKRKIVRLMNGDSGIFYDEVNFWLEPQVYSVSVELIDLGNKLVGRRKFVVDLLEYAQDAKEISDLIAAKLIDESFTDERFNKPVGRVIPMTQAETEANVPFYFYHEVYNLQTKDGQYQLRTTYEIYNKEKMRKEIVDALIQDAIGDGDIAHLAAKYHPMDLPVGAYVVVARDKDLISGVERTAIGEFRILSRKN